MNNFQGMISKIIFKSDNNYNVILFRVLKNDLDDKFNNKFITITGYFYDIEEDLLIEVTGEFQKHTKYGEQLNVSSYQRIIPEDKSSIIKFLASDLFKGIGEAKATKIYEKLGDDSINLIKNDIHVLDNVFGLTKKNIEVIKNKLAELEESSDVIIKLTELGFSVKDSTLINKFYKEKTLSIIEKDLYNPFYDLEKISFSKVDLIAKKNNYDLNDKRRIKAGIIFVMQSLAFSFGDTYSSVLEISSALKNVLNIEISDNSIFESLNELVQDFKIFDLNENYQLKEYYEADDNIVKKLTYLNNKKDIQYKEGQIDKLLNKCSQKFKIIYDDEQVLAIKQAFIKNFLIITGGPGTGKTTIIKTIVEIYKQIFKFCNEEIALLAPTGRASKRIMEATGDKASTIHRFLKWNKDTNKFQINEYNKSDVKLVIVDEASMVDTLVFSSLLKGIKYDTKIILVGDNDQLPSVSPGQVLKDLIETELFSVVKLKSIYRQSKGSNIITLAHDVNKELINYELFNQNEDLFFYKADSLNIQEILLKIIEKYKNIDYLDYQVMAPMYKTLNGINNLNRIMQKFLNPPQSNKNEIVIYDILYREGDKVLQLMNMPEDNVYNGDIGVIISIDNILKEVTIDFDSNIVTYNGSNFQNFTLGYVISIHKSQGSEFKTVIIPILKEYGRMLYKKLIYTGITRSKENLILIGEKDAFDKGISNIREDNRKTNLKEKIKKRYI